MNRIDFETDHGTRTAYFDSETHTYQALCSYQRAATIDDLRVKVEAEFHRPERATEKRPYGDPWDFNA